MEKDQTNERKGKYTSHRDEVLHQIAGDGWANESSGSVDCITGWFARVSIAPNEVQEIADAFTDTLYNVGLDETAPLVGHFLVVEDGDGFVTVAEHESEETLKYDYGRLQELYLDWLGDAE